MENALVSYVPVIALLFVIGLVVYRLPKIDLGHSPAFLRRRFWNWLPLGLTYALLYMGRYNLTVSKNFLPQGLMSKEDFGEIFAWGAVVYGLSFLVNGPLTDRIGGRATILLAAAGSAVMNAALGIVVLLGWTDNIVVVFSVIYGLNMYFQSFGAVSIVKVNAAWFHVRERGAFGGIFGILISLGIFLAFDVGRMIAEHTRVEWVFFAPAVLLSLFFVVSSVFVRNQPSDAGFDDFDTADASSGDGNERLPVFAVMKKMFTNPVIITIALVEFCSGFLRNAIMHWYPIMAKETGIQDTFVPKNWGMLLCCAGILGGMFAGQISDRVFQSRRGPVAGVLYAGMLVGALGVYFVLNSPLLGWLVVFMSLCVIGVHGMLSGTASMDFGGKKNVGVAVGLIDGCVYLGTAAQSYVLGHVLPKGDAANDPAQWTSWPMAMVPVAVLGLFLASRVWNASPKPSSRGKSDPPPSVAAPVPPVDTRDARAVTV
ncbi:MAG: MFS transporter [Polyangiales bacterium]